MSEARVEAETYPREKHFVTGSGISITFHYAQRSRKRYHPINQRLRIYMVAEAMHCRMKVNEMSFLPANHKPTIRRILSGGTTTSLHPSLSAPSPNNGPTSQNQLFSRACTFIDQGQTTRHWHTGAVSTYVSPSASRSEASKVSRMLLILSLRTYPTDGVTLPGTRTLERYWRIQIGECHRHATHQWSGGRILEPKQQMGTI